MPVAIGTPGSNIAGVVRSTALLPTSFWSGLVDLVERCPTHLAKEAQRLLAATNAMRHVIMFSHHGRPASMYPALTA